MVGTSRLRMGLELKYLLWKFWWWKFSPKAQLGGFAEQANTGPNSCGPQFLITIALTLHMGTKRGICLSN